MSRSGAEATDVVVVGGGPAGLAAAAQLRRVGASAVVLDAGERAGSSWAAHYDSLRLNTVSWTSHLPGLRFSRADGPYPGRDQVVGYLARYAEHHRLDVRWGTRVDRIERVDPLEPSGATWAVHAGAQRFVSDAVVLATGSCGRPRLPDWPGRDGFGGRVLHSSAYRNSGEFTGRRVLVVGAGNSGGEIAADLAGGGAGAVLLSVRTAPQVVPRRVLGVPTVLAGIATRWLPPVVGDGVTRVLRRAVLSDLGRHGLVASTEPLSRQYRERGVVPLSHPGFFAQLRRGAIEVVPAVERLSAAGVHLVGGRVIEVDDVIAATGFETGLADLVGGLDVLDSRGRPLIGGGRTLPQAPRLYAIGFADPLTGNLREIRLEAGRLARAHRDAGLAPHVVGTGTRHRHSVAARSGAVIGKRRRTDGESPERTSPPGGSPWHTRHADLHVVPNGGNDHHGRRE